jgi:hypothetical protein
VASIVVHGGGSSAVVRFADPDFRHRLLGSKQEVPIERNGLALRITRNRESANTDEVRCWGDSWGVWLSADDLWRFFSPHGASGQQRRGLQSKTLPQKRQALSTREPGRQGQHCGRTTNTTATATTTAGPAVIGARAGNSGAVTPTGTAVRRGPFGSEA